MGQVARPLSVHKGLKTPWQETHNHTMIIQQNLKEELLEEEEQQTGNTDEIGLNEININIVTGQKLYFAYNFICA